MFLSLQEMKVNWATSPSNTPKQDTSSKYSCPPDSSLSPCLQTTVHSQQAILVLQIVNSHQTSHQIVVYILIKKEQSTYLTTNSQQTTLKIHDLIANSQLLLYTFQSLNDFSLYLKKTFMKIVLQQSVQTLSKSSL